MAKKQRAVLVIDGVEFPCPNRSRNDHHLNGRHHVQIHVGKLFPDEGTAPLDPNGPRETIVIQWPQAVYRLELNRVVKIVKKRRAEQAEQADPP